MKRIEVDTSRYTALPYAQSELKSFANKNIHRYRQDIFPNPDAFGLKIEAVIPEIKEDRVSIYTHRMTLTVLFADNADDAAVERYKAAMVNKARRFELSDRERRTPAAEPARDQAEPAQEHWANEAFYKRGRRKKTLDETVLDQRINDDIAEELGVKKSGKKKKK